VKHRLFPTMLASALVLSGCLAAAQDSEPNPKPKAKAAHAARPHRSTRKEAKSPVKAVDINRASKDELKKLPGITDALADKIIAGRPYVSKSRLVTQNVLPRGVYEGIREQIAAVYVATPKKK